MSSRNSADQIATPRSGRLTPWLLLLAPAIALIAILIIIPLVQMVEISLMQKDRGGIDWDSGYSFDAYTRFFFERNLFGERVFQLDYAVILWRSVYQAALTTLITLLIGYPTALWIARQPSQRQQLLVFLVTIPFWTSFLIRNYAWIVILRANGLISALLVWLGVTEEPVSLLYNDFAISVGLTYSFLPFMVLPIYANLERMDWRLVEASQDLGAGRLVALRRIVIPLSMPGVVAGSILVFVPCLGAFITPALLGGGKTLMFGNLIELQFGFFRNWPFGSALSLILLVMVLAVLSISYVRRLRRQH